MVPHRLHRGALAVLMPAYVLEVREMELAHNISYCTPGQHDPGRNNVQVCYERSLIPGWDIRVSEPWPDKRLFPPAAMAVCSGAVSQIFFCKQFYSNKVVKFNYLIIEMSM
jgi:hypothetical protein